MQKYLKLSGKMHNMPFKDVLQFLSQLKNVLVSTSADLKIGPVTDLTF